VHVGFPALRMNPPAPAAPRLLEQRAASNTQVPKRRRIWELSNNFHCSIIGTCLTTAELRQILVKIELPGAHKDTDHELHGRAVLLAGQRDLGSKLLQKALDRRHRSAIGQFNRARSADELRALWASAVQRAEIPGAYWAVLTHPHATETLVRHVFGEVHMLSHLVGAANRADIRRLRELEAENAVLQEKIARQQRQLRDAVVTRDATIANLNDLVGRAIVSVQPTPSGAEQTGDAERATTAQLVADLRRRLASEIAGREKTERRLASLATERDDERKQRRLLEENERDLRQELEAAELSLAAQLPEPGRESEPPVSMPGTTLLYVGGRAHQVVQLRMLAERSGAVFLHHDGGIENRSALLEAQVARSDVVFFPVDCVSHNAVATVKRISRYVGKRYIALRSSGLTSFAAALHSIAAAQQPFGATETGVQPQPT
jgi:Uncharacterized protein conserved in bacteria (DUF2325)